MKSKIFCTAFLALSLVAGPCEAAGVTARTLIRDVNVVPMATEKVLRGRTVVVTGRRITAIEGKVRAQPGDTVIDGRGAWLVPGLADMHVHADTSRDLQLFLRRGVTTVLNMGGASTEFVDQVVPAINDGRRPGPHVYLALRVDGTPEYGQLVIGTPDEARAIVGIAKTNRYDFIKAYTNLSTDVFEALVDEGRRRQMPVVGHAVASVGVERQLAAGQAMVAHLEEFLPYIEAPSAPNGEDRAGQDGIARAVALVRRSKAYVTADLLTYQTIAAQWGRPVVAAAYLSDPRVATLQPSWRLSWPRAGYAARAGSLDDRLAVLRRFARALANGGVPLIAGTDAPTIPGIFSGDSLLEDLFALHAAGLSPFQALATATRDAGAFIRDTKPGQECFGVVAVGCRADLLLLRANPLSGLEALRDQQGVMAAGAWYPHDELEKMAESVARDYRFQ